MKRAKIKVSISVAMMITIAVVCIAVNSVIQDSVKAGTLSYSEMSKIIGTCGCHTEVSERGCTEGDDPPDQCGGSCSAYNLAGANPNYCDSKPPENDWTCEFEDDVTCKTPYSCSSEKKSGFKCSGGSCIEAWFKNCYKCTCTAGTPNKLSSHYCDS